MPNCKVDGGTYPLLVAGSATGAWVPINGGEYAFLLDASTNTGTLSLQMKSPSGAGIDVQVFSGSFVRTMGVAFAQVQIDLPACDVRVALTGGTCTNVNAYLQGCG
jgi:hypothetical protein